MKMGDDNKPDDGEWFRMSYAVAEALYKTETLNKNHIRLILYIARMTWGWNRKTFIFNTQEAIKATGIPANRMTYLFKPLVEASIIFSERGEYGINKYIDQWDLTHLEATTEGRFRKTEPVPKNGITSEKRKSEFRKTEEKIPKNGILRGRKSANSAPLDDPKDNKDNLKDSRYREHLEVLRSVAGYPLLPKTDADFLAKLETDYPALDLLETLKSWAAYKLDKPLKPKESPRAQIRTWAKNDSQWGRNQKTNRASAALQPARQYYDADLEHERSVLRDNIAHLWVKAGRFADRFQAKRELDGWTIEQMREEFRRGTA